jgi:hypothetical protein
LSLGVLDEAPESMAPESSWLQKALAAFQALFASDRQFDDSRYKVPTHSLVPIIPVDSSSFGADINRYFAEEDEKCRSEDVVVKRPDDSPNEVHVEIGGRTIKLTPSIEYFAPGSGGPTMPSAPKSRKRTAGNGKIYITAEDGPLLPDPGLAPKLAAIQADLALIDQWIGDLVVNMKLDPRINKRRRTPYVRIIHAFMDGADLGLKYWSFDEQQHRKILVRDIEQIVETQTGEVFASFEEWLADLEHSPRYKPDRELTRCYYKIQYGVPVFREICRLGQVDRQLAREAVSRYVRWRLTEGSTSDSSEDEIAALDERLWHEHIPADEPFLDNIASVLTKRQISSIYETARELAQHAIRPSEDLTAIVDKLERLATPRRGGRVRPAAFSPRPPPRTTSP